jgi:hypothetical protein
MKWVEFLTAMHSRRGQIYLERIDCIVRAMKAIMLELLTVESEELATTVAWSHIVRLVKLHPRLHLPLRATRYLHHRLPPRR